jgi:hypothetical protein
MNKVPPNPSFSNTVIVTGLLNKVGYINKLSNASIEIVSDNEN